MKCKSKYLVLLLLLLVVCGGMVTYAIYKTNKSGNATVNAARWNVVFKNGEETISNNFNIQLSNATWTNPLGNVASGKIAPGSSSTFYITIDATNTETDVYYEAVIGDSFNDPDFEVTVGEDSGIISYSTTSGAMIKQIPITVVWNGNINDSETKNSDDLLKKAQNITIPVTITAAQKLALRYTVTFNDGFGNVISTKKVSEGDTVGTLPANPTKIGYTFNGWYDDPTNGNQVTTETVASQGMNIYAHWDVKFVRVTFDSNGGSNVIPREIQEGRSLPDVPTTTKDGSDFLGWFDENDNQLTTSTIIMNNITYTASWNNAYLRAGTLVYYDPISNDTCNSNSFNLEDVNNGTSTCYKWYIVKEDDSNSTLILDHNLVNNVKWYDIQTTAQGPYTVMDSLASQTSNWNRVNPLTYSYDVSSVTGSYGTLTCTNGNCTMPAGTISNVKARLITGEEVAKLTGISNWLITDKDALSDVPNWLFDNTLTSSYGTSSGGYLTLSPESSGYAWLLFASRSQLAYSSCSDAYYGARPVITVPKTDLN